MRFSQPPQLNQQHSFTCLVRSFVTVAFLVLICLALPLQAFALDTAKCTARPNGKSGSAVYGGTQTRITWEGQAEKDEVVTGIQLTFPEGTTFGVDDVRVTELSGEDNMTRTSINAQASAQGQELSVRFDQAISAGGYVRVEVYEVVFPSAGGDMKITGGFTLKGGTEQVLPDFAPIVVTGVSPTDALAADLAEQDWVKAWNENKFLRLFLNPTILVSSFPIVFQGFLMAVAIVAVAFPLAIPFGLCLALMRMAHFKLAKWISSLYVNVVRGTPLFLQIYIAFFGLPLAGIQVPPFPLGVIVLSLNSAAYLCEIFRAGIQSIPPGQNEASRSLGMNGAQTMIFVIIPQTIRRVIPTMTSEFILLYKDTSMLAAVGVMEVVMYAKTIVANTGSITPYIVAACFYLVITIPLAKIVGRLETKLAGVQRFRKHKNAHTAPDAHVVDHHKFAGTDTAGVTSYGTDVLTSQPVIKSNKLPKA